MTHSLSVVLGCGLMALVAAADDKSKTVEPFNGKDLSGWKFKTDKGPGKWRVGKAILAADAQKLTVAESGHELINADRGGVDIYSEAKFGDAVIELEVMVPKGSNSG